MSSLGCLKVIALRYHLRDTSIFASVYLRGIRISPPSYSQHQFAPLLTVCASYSHSSCIRLTVFIGMMINKIRPQRTFSPRSFMGDRGIHLDTLGKVRDTMFEDEKIIAPKPWKACKSPIVQRSYTWYVTMISSDHSISLMAIKFKHHNHHKLSSLTHIFTIIILFYSQGC